VRATCSHNNGSCSSEYIAQESPKSGNGQHVFSRRKRFIVGIALDASGVRGSSEDFVFLDTSEWTAERRQNAQKIRDKLGYFKDGTVTLSRVSEDEYPGSRSKIDVPKLAEELLHLTVSESIELAGMLKAKWGGSKPAG
jgi:hypothetical protein